MLMSLSGGLLVYLTIITFGMFFQESEEFWLDIILTVYLIQYLWTAGRGFLLGYLRLISTPTPLLTINQTSLNIHNYKCHLIDKLGFWNGLVCHHDMSMSVLPFSCYWWLTALRYIRWVIGSAFLAWDLPPPVHSPANINDQKRTKRQYYRRRSSSERESEPCLERAFQC